MEKNNKKKYQSTYGLLRIIACFSVIFHHFITYNQSYINTLPSATFLGVLDNLLMCNNGLFFMLSGKFALENYDGKIGKYYKNKITKIGVPFLLYSLCAYVVTRLQTGEALSPYGFIKAFLANDITGYLWFIYSLIGFYLVVPFLAPMLKAMSQKEINWFTVLLVGIILLRNLCRVFHKNFVLDSFPFFESAYFLLGYLIERIRLTKKKEGLIYLAAVPATVISCYLAVNDYEFNPDLYDKCVSRMLMCASVFLLVTRHTKKFSDLCAESVKYLSNQTYYIYLLHGGVQAVFVTWFVKLWLLMAKLPFVLALFWGSVIIFALTFILSATINRLLNIFKKKGGYV